MRELKFKAWDKTGKRWVSYEESGFFYCNFYTDGSGRFILHVIDPMTENHVDNIVIVEYTGLKDKNGKEIYIGDILMLNNENYDPGNDLYYEGRAMVKPTKELGFTFYCIDPVDEWNFDSTSMWHVGEEDTTEIIGNVYENPELLKTATK